MARTIKFRNVDGLYKTLATLTKEASGELRTESLAIAGDVATKAAGLARDVGGVATLVAPTLKARRDRIPKVAMGGTKRLPPIGGRPRHGAEQTVGDVIYGAEFGGGRRPTTRQFKPWRGNKGDAGYFLWPTVRAEYDTVVERYGEALMRAVDKAARRSA